MQIMKNQIAVVFVFGAAAAAIAMAGAPDASAAPSGGVCADAGGSVDCRGQGNEQVYASPKPLPRVFPPSINPRWRDLGYSARFPKYGFDPKWQSFGYNPLYSGFQPRPSVLKPFQLSGIQDDRPPVAKPTDTGGSTIYQTAGDAQIAARIGMAARYATQAQYPSPARSAAEDDGAPTMHQSMGDAQITAKPGPAAQSAAGQSAFFPLPGLPTA